MPARLAAVCSRLAQQLAAQNAAARCVAAQQALTREISTSSAQLEDDDKSGRPTTPWVRQVISGVDLMRHPKYNKGAHHVQCSLRFIFLQSLMYPWPRAHALGAFSLSCSWRHLPQGPLPRHGWHPRLNWPVLPAAFTSCYYLPLNSNAEFAPARRWPCICNPRSSYCRIPCLLQPCALRFLLRNDWIFDTVAHVLACNAAASHAIVLSPRQIA